MINIIIGYEIALNNQKTQSSLNIRNNNSDNKKHPVKQGGLPPLPSGNRSVASLRGYSAVENNQRQITDS